jgi:hypothetical protein
MHYAGFLAAIHKDVHCRFCSFREIVGAMSQTSWQLSAAEIRERVAQIIETNQDAVNDKPRWRKALAHLAVELDVCESADDQNQLYWRLHTTDAQLDMTQAWVLAMIHFQRGFPPSHRSLSQPATL